MPLPRLLENLRLPVVAAPMFIAGNPKLVIAQCKAGIVGAFPALNARPKEALDEWLIEIETARAAVPGAAPYAVNQIVHKSNDRLEHDVAVCVKHKVPITITSLRAPTEVVGAVHGYGGIVFHDVISVRHAEKALEEEILKAAAADIVYTDLFSGVHGNYLKHSVVAAGYDPQNLPKSDPSQMNFGTAGGAEKKVWRDIWSASQGVGSIDRVMPVADVVTQLAAEYTAARRRLQLN